jgi:long-chain acyl-CoA synthetase
MTMATPEAAVAAGGRPLLQPAMPLPLRAEDVDGDTFAGVLLRQVERFGDRRCISYKDAEGRWPEVSWRELRDAAAAFGAALVHAGVGVGDRVALLAENRLEWLYCDAGSQLAAAVVVPIYASSTADMVGEILDDCDAVAVICSTPQQADKVSEVRDRCPALRTMVLMEGEARGFASLTELASAVNRDDLDTLAQRARQLRADDILTIIYTSGTTGRPKGVMLTNRNVVEECRAILQVVRLRGDDHGLSFLPWAHVYERVQGIFGGMMAGITAAVARDLTDVAGDLRAVRPTAMNAVPRLYEKMQEAIEAHIQHAGGLRSVIGRRGIADCTERARRRRQGRRVSPPLELRCRLWERLVIRTIREGLGGRARIFSSGGGPISLATLEFFDALGIAIIEGYGLTETAGGVTANDPDAPRFGTVGRAIPGHEVRIAEDGEILLRGPAIMKGYFRNDEATAEVLKDGWFYTGDIGELDAEGYLRITDRKKDLIVTAGGTNVAPGPIEAAMMQDPLVLRATVIGDRRKYLVALIVPDFGALREWARQNGVDALSEADLVADERVQRLYQAIAERVSSRLAGYETIKKVAVLDRDLSEEKGELTPTLKVKRRVVQENFAQVIDRLYA